MPGGDGGREVPRSGLARGGATLCRTGRFQPVAGSSLFSAQMPLDRLSSRTLSSGARDGPVTQDEPDCRIYLVVEAAPAAIEHLSAAAKVADIACCLILPATGTPDAATRARPIVAAAQQAGIAALIAGDADLARALRADGVHLAPSPQILAAYSAARQMLGRDAIVGADAGVSRHDAMSLAEAGADYVAFGAPSHLKDRARARERRDALLAWWSEIFEVACVALDVEAADEAERLAHAGADFVAVAVPSTPAAATGELIAKIGAAIGANVEAG
jgi:thiamine-phosphate pyrophosphorylase